MPGFKKEDIHIFVEEGTLRLEAERSDTHTEGDATKYHKERRWGNVKRIVHLPPTLSVEKDPDVLYENGVLRLIFDKKESTAKKLQIA